jgi:DNA-binding beta-propeller fold protein YncE
MRRRKLLMIPLILIMLALDCGHALAGSNVPYQTYNYDYWRDIYYTPAAYIPAGNLSGAKLGVGAMSEPLDLYVAEDGKVYIADTGNNRIIILDSDMKNPRLLEGFDNNGTADSFNKPSGVYVTPRNELYIADTANKRIVALREDGKLLKIISNPKSEVLADDFDFSPLKVTVDYADRVYVIAKGKIQGILAFDPEGNFTGFVGTIKVSISAYEKFWRRLSTKAQRKRQLQFIPTEFTGLDIAPDGFIYATNVDPDAIQSVRRLNPKGQDVIKKNANNYEGIGKLSGDLYYRTGTEYAGPSRIVDVVYRGKGIYSILDMIRGRIFTYDHEGNLLYIFGGMGSQEGTFKLPAAIEIKEDKILVLDSQRAELVTFVATEYGRLINEAVALRYDGDEAAAVALWEKVLELDSNFELAYVGIGKAYLAAGDNKTAMKYLKLGMERNYYSIAFKRYRDEILKENMGYILTGISLLVVAAIVFRQVRKRRGKGGTEDE